MHHLTALPDHQVETGNILEIDGIANHEGRAMHERLRGNHAIQDFSA